MQKINDFVHISESFKAYNPQKLILFTTDVIANLSNDKTFLPMAEDVVNLTNSLNAYKQYVNSNSENKRISEIEVNEKHVNLLWELICVALRVNHLGRGDLKTVLLSGFKPQRSGDKQQIMSLETPTGFSVYYSTHKVGDIGIYCDPVPNATFYEIEVHEGDENKSYLLEPQTSSSSFFNHLTAGKKMWFRMRASSRRNVRSEWTKWAAIVIPLSAEESTPLPDKRRKK
jgi:hypothetical protein